MCGLFNVHGTLELNDESNLSENEKSVFLCSDLCARESVLAGVTEKLPILRELQWNEKDEKIDMDISNVLWLDTRSGTVQFIHLYLRNHMNETPAVKSCMLKCTLLVFPKKYDRE